MKRKIRRLVAPLALAVAAMVAWAAFPGAFVRGVVAGVVLTLALISAGFFVIARRMRRRLGDRLKAPPLPTGAWDYQMDAQTLAGETVGFSRFSGKVLILNFWATWCGPCVAEMPSLARLRDATADLDVTMACVTREDQPVVEKFIEKRGIDVPIYLLRGDLPECFVSRAIPATYILDRTGQVALRHLGAAKWDDGRVVSFVRGLAAVPTS
jgi:thiol-disulfide isomerase/thioredoxin